MLIQNRCFLRPTVREDCSLTNHYPTTDLATPPEKAFASVRAHPVMEGGPYE